MKHLVALSMILSTVPLTIYGWTRTYGGETDDVGYCVQQTDDGGYIIIGGTGVTYYSGEKLSDVWLLKTDAMGDTLWTREWGDEQSIDVGNCVQQTADGGYIITGYTQNVINDHAWLLKTDSKGDTLWRRDYREDSLRSRRGYCVQQTSDGSYIITGWGTEGSEAGYAVWLMKTDSTGGVMWVHTYDQPENIYGSYDVGYCVQQTADGGYIFTGCGDAGSEEGWMGNLWLLKADSLGDTLWTRTYEHLGGGWMATFNCGYFVRQTTDGGYVIAGVTTLEGKLDADIWLLKTDSQGDTVWTHTYSREGRAEKGRCVRQTADGGYIIVGGSLPFKSPDLWLLKTNAVGDTLWTRTYGVGLADDGYCVQETSDGGYVIVGITTPSAGQPDLWLLKTNEYGDTVWYEGSPREVLVPREDAVIDTMIPTAWFKNTGTYPIQNFYCHCQIWPKGTDSLTILSPPYHVKYLISYPLEAGDSVLVKFSEWFSDDSSRYLVKFYTSKEDEPLWQTREKFVEFQGVPDVGVTEDTQEVSLPSFELVSNCGPQVFIQYSGYPQGFKASIYDTSGRKVGVLESQTPSGTTTWGEGHASGVYFIRANKSKGELLKRIVLIR